jgi:hypothetical protein
VACVQALNSDRQELQRIQSLLIDNYNRQTRGSAWAAASEARNNALASALDDYYQAFSNAFDGLKSAANGWIAQGNVELSKARAQATIMSREIDGMNLANSQIDAAFSAFATRQRGTSATCGF